MVQAILNSQERQSCQGNFVTLCKAYVTTNTQILRTDDLMSLILMFPWKGFWQLLQEQSWNCCFMNVNSRKN